MILLINYLVEKVTETQKGGIKMKLIATSNTEIGIAELSKEYFMNEKIIIMWKEYQKEGILWNNNIGKQIDDFVVLHEKNRYRLESLKPRYQVGSAK